MQHFESAARFDIGSRIRRRRVPKSCERYVRQKLAGFGRQAEPAHQSLVFDLQRAKGIRRRYPRHDGSWTISAKHMETFDRHAELTMAKSIQFTSDLVRERQADVPDEAQRDMIVRRFDPAGARQAATQHSQLFGFMPGDLQTREKSRHFLTRSLAGWRGRGSESLDKDRFDERKKPVHNAFDALGVWMEAVRKGLVGMTHHAF